MIDYRVRARIFVGVIALLLGLLVLRLAQMQLWQTELYAGESRSNAVREQRVIPARGAIYDRNGVLLVDNAPAYSLLITPRYFDPKKIPLLARLLEVPDSVVANRLAQARAWSAYRPSRVFTDLPFETFSRVVENLYRLPGVQYEIDQRRRYHTPVRAAHALGYVREITRAELEQLRDDGYAMGDRIGKAGLEKFYEKALRGVPGRAFKLVNIHGQEIKPYRDGAEDVPPISGYDLHLGLDYRVQALAESLFVGKRGAAVALDPNNGEIIALVSMPDFDPEVLSGPIDPETWRYLTTSPEKPLFNRATMSGVPPGSTWKPFMALVGLQEGVITARSTIYCPGGYLLGGRLFRCHGGAHGSLDVREAIQLSCNTFFFTVMMRLDVNTLRRWANRFGFGVPAPMDIAEQNPGLIPDSAYYNRRYPRGWTAGYTINLGIGQGDMTVTPMQLARYVAAIANGGTLYPPHLVRELVHPETGEVLKPQLPPPEHIPIKPEYFQIVREGMRRVMEAGTGRWVQIPGIPSGGKTGTAQAPGGRKDHSLFIMFAPYHAPKIAIAVFVENAGFGATVAAPIASLMAELYLTGEVATTPQRRYLLEHVLRQRSQPLDEPTVTQAASR
ncbi:penicillin-binding protein 2 [Rhodothermus marinus]|uniref:penicillin-binding protein 2 n=1 Tax=Rhodothermus marinus TaxID=29549 RepID=UPI0012BA49CE|nr:penicillin-binding protein 2 [Rhodothermus marinus]BBM68814.1 penicillin-binding protein 2 [Rhodothermus marinus]